MNSVEKANGTVVLKREFTFAPGTEAYTTTTRIAGEYYSGGWTGNFTYCYDNVGNVTSINKNGEFYASYVYDNNNQLTHAIASDALFAYTYDDSGNITKKEQYVVDPHTDTMQYANTQWGDQLSWYNDDIIMYDGLGCPIVYRDGMQFSWLGRRLETATYNGSTYYYAYNTLGEVYARKSNSTTANFLRKERPSFWALFLFLRIKTKVKESKTLYSEPL